MNLVKTQNATSTSKSLADQLTNCKSSLWPYCDHCKHARHWMSKCHKFDGNKCYNCGKIRHQQKNCWSKKKGKEKEKEKKGVEQVNYGEKEISFLMCELIFPTGFSTTQRFWCTWMTIQLTIPNYSNQSWLEGECWDRQSKAMVWGQLLIIECSLMHDLLLA